MEENNNNKKNELKESMSQFSKIQPNEEQMNIKTLEEIKKEINDKLNSFNNNKSTELENEIKKLNEMMEKNLEKLEEKKIEKIEEEKFYGCNFTDENYIVLYNEGLKYFKINVNLLNNGNLPWPINSYVYGESQDGIWKFNKITINKDKEILPNESFQFPLSIIIPKNIPFENGEIILPLNLCFVDKSVQIKQNTLKIKLIIKKLEKSESQRNMFPKKPKDQTTTESIHSDEPKKNPQKEIGKINSSQTKFENSSSEVINNENEPNKTSETIENNSNRHTKLKNIDNNDNNENNNNNIHDGKNDNSGDIQKVKDDNEEHNPESDNVSVPKINKDEKNSNIISEDRFNKIKNKLEEDYNLSNIGWSDEELKNKIHKNLNDDLNNLFGTDEDEAIGKIVEMIGEELLELI